MKSPLATFKKISLVLFVLTLIMSTNSSFSQSTALQSRVAIKIVDAKTSIWISDFPIKATVMLVDGENNLLGMITTNEFGAAYTSLNKVVLSAIVARTLNGEVNVTNKAVIKLEKSQEAVAVSDNVPNDKA